MGRQIVILGGGTGGVAAANVLRKALPPGQQVTLVDKSCSHRFLAALPLLIVGRRQPRQITRPLALLQNDNVRFLQAEVKRISPQGKTVETECGLLKYDYLIIALGARRTTNALPGQALFAHDPYDLLEAARLHETLTRFSRGRVVLFIAGLPFTGAIAPYELSFLLREYFNRRGLADRVRLVFVTPEKFPLETGGLTTSHKYLRLFQKRRIQVITRARVQAVEKNGLLLEGGRRIPADLIIGIPLHFGPALFTSPALRDRQGWLKVNRHTLAMDAQDVYAIGDAVGTPTLPKVGFYAHYEAEVVARNIALEIAGEKPRFRFQGGALGASMLTETGRGCFVSLKSFRVPPRFSISSPNFAAAVTKSLFEKYWLNFWFRPPS